MITARGLDKKQKEILLKMTDQELKQYIDNIANEYYNCIINQDAVQLNQCIVNLNKLNEIFEDKNLDKYITFTLINGFNEVLLNSSINKFQLLELKEPGLTSAMNKPFTKTKLDVIIDTIFYKKVDDKEKEIKGSIKGKEDILKLFNYEDYVNRIE